MDQDGVDAAVIFPPQRTMIYFMGDTDAASTRRASGPTTTGSPGLLRPLSRPPRRRLADPDPRRRSPRPGAPRLEQAGAPACPRHLADGRPGTLARGRPLLGGRRRSEAARSTSTSGSRPAHQDAAGRGQAGGAFGWPTSRRRSPPCRRSSPRSSSRGSSIASRGSASWAPRSAPGWVPYLLERDGRSLSAQPLLVEVNLRAAAQRLLRAQLDGRLRARSLSGSRTGTPWESIT